MGGLSRQKSLNIDYIDDHHGWDWDSGGGSSPGCGNCNGSPSSQMKDGEQKHHCQQLERGVGQETRIFIVVDRISLQQENDDEDDVEGEKELEEDGEELSISRSSTTSSRT